MGLQPEYTGLQPGGVGLQPDCTGLQPGGVGLRPGCTGLQPGLPGGGAHRHELRAPLRLQRPLRAIGLLRLQHHGLAELGEQVLPLFRHAPVVIIHVVELTLDLGREQGAWHSLRPAGAPEAL